MSIEMDEEFLNSVIKITKNSDVDSLEFSLLKTFVEFLSCRKIKIYKNLKFFNALGVEESVSLTIEQGLERWQQNRLVESPESELMSCLNTGSTIVVNADNDIEKRWHPINVMDETIGAIFIEVEKLDTAKQILINALGRIYENYLKVLNESERDKLTGLLNRQTFEKKIDGLMKKQNQTQNQLFEDVKEQRILMPNATSWLAIVDLDKFKQINDRFGHICGDEVLLTLSQLMQTFFRRTDLLFRFGGEEFIIVLGPTTQEMAMSRLDLFRKEVEKKDFPLVGNVTLSIGVSQISPYDFPMQVVSQADKALYFAKEHGRNQLHCYEDLIKKGDLVNESKKSDVDLF